MTLNDFIANLEREVKNHSIYVWGGGGQTAPTITESWIKAKENSSENAARAIAHWKKECAAGYGNVLRAFDCSGLGTYCLGKTKAKANTMMGWTQKITRAELRRGDWVFRVDSSGKAYHIGYVVDAALNVIEAKGRDDGVIRRAISAFGSSYWNRFGRYNAFASEINASVPASVTLPSAPASTASAWELMRLLKRVTPMLSGEDVKSAQAALIARGYSCGTAGADGKFGDATDFAVKAFQQPRKLKVDGVIGKDTCTALGGVWKG